jgi:inosine-uridine nucleoside N-ribohydrolase
MTDFPEIAEAERLEMLTPPGDRRVRMVLDTDTYNEIDDQFAVAYSMMSPDKLDVEAIYAAPFVNSRSEGPRDGMEKSHQEILRVLQRLGKEADGFVFKGSGAFLPGPNVPVESDAARDLIVKASSGNSPLYVVAIGAISNVASAIIMEPEIIKRIVVVWLGGHPHYWPQTREFNLAQDLWASRLVFDCGVPLVQVPCRNVAEMLRTTKAELAEHLKGKNPLGDYLYKIFCEFVPDEAARSKPIWDVSTIAWLLNPEAVQTELVHSPVLTDQVTYRTDSRRHLVRVATWVDRDWVFRDLFGKIERA